jgi:hypothetical protein
MSIFSSLGNVASGQLKSIPIIGGVVSDFEAGQQENKIKELAANKPMYSRPDEITEMLQNARANTTSQMPGYTEAQQNIDRTIATGSKNIKEMSGGGGSSLAAAQQ